jgi:hypothetical protein
MFSQLLWASRRTSTTNTSLLFYSPPRWVQPAARPLSGPHGAPQLGAPPHRPLTQAFFCSPPTSLFLFARPLGGGHGLDNIYSYIYIYFFFNHRGLADRGRRVFVAAGYGFHIYECPGARGCVQGGVIAAFGHEDSVTTSACICPFSSRLKRHGCFQAPSNPSRSSEREAGESRKPTSPPTRGLGVQGLPAKPRGAPLRRHRHAPASRGTPLGCGLYRDISTTHLVDPAPPSRWWYSPSGTSSPSSSEEVQSPPPHPCDWL